MFRKNLAQASAICAVLLAAQGAAYAATISCTGTSPAYDISDKVSNTSNCAILQPIDANQNDNLAIVNSAGFFGISNWLLDGKYDNLTASGGTDTSALFNFTGGMQSGSYIYAGSTPAPTDVMLVFKDGEGTNPVAYLLTQPYGGDYSSPFTDPPFPLPGNSTIHNISHITVYYRNGDNGGGDTGGGQVPEPASLALIGVGLLCMSRLGSKR